SLWAAHGSSIHGPITSPERGCGSPRRKRMRYIYRITAAPRLIQTSCCRPKNLARTRTCSLRCPVSGRQSRARSLPSCPSLGPLPSTLACSSINLLRTLLFWRPIGQHCAIGGYLAYRELKSFSPCNPYGAVLLR